MNRQWITFFFLLILCGKIFAQPETDYTKTSSLLLEKASQAQEDYIRFSILLTERADMHAMNANFHKQRTPLAERTRRVISTLKTTAANTQGDLLNFLNQSPDVLPGSVESFWITNLIFVTARPGMIATLSQRADVAWLEYDYAIALVEPDSRTELAERGVTESAGGVEPGLLAINAPAMWALGYTGYGRKTLTIDTGADPTHPAIAGHYWGNFVPENLAWLDPVSGSASPFDCDSHGSHVTGTMVGLDPATSDTIGVAPEGVWMASAAICDNSSNDNLAVMQWAIDPDGDSTTIWDMPDAINCSWWAPDVDPNCNSEYVDVLSALEAAGVAVVFAAGNFGPGPSTVTIPQDISTDLVNAFSVGAVNGNVQATPIVGFSSRGPSNCGTEGSLLIKPEVSAPGLNVRSSVLNGTYALFSGTSMASPHVAGAVLLLKQAFPYLSGTDLKLALYYSAIDLGQPGEDNSYGMGLIDVYAAYNYLVTQGNTPASPNASFDVAAKSIINLDTLICGASGVSPLLLVKNEGDSAVTSMDIVYGYASGQRDTFFWTGLIQPGALFLISLPASSLSSGSYTLDVELRNPNGSEDSRFLDNRILQRLTVTPDPEIPPVSADICVNANALLSVSPQAPWTALWYEDSIGGNSFSQGSTYYTPTLSADKVYYVGSGLSGSLGLSDTLSGKGGYDAANTGFMTFDCAAEITLKSVKVYTNNVGIRLFRVTDASGNQIAVKNFQMLSGEQELDLSFTIPAGTGYKLHYSGLWGMYRQTTGATYPYDLNGLVTITGSDGGDSSYAYFFDWNVIFEGTCPRAAVTVNTLPGTMNTAFAATPGSVKLPNQTGDVQFTDLSANAVTWKWDFGDGGTSTDQNPLHTYSLVDTYAVSLEATGADGCADTYIDTVVVEGWNTAIDDIDPSGSQILVYPNPSGGVFNVKFSFDTPTEVEIYVTDIVGRVISTPFKKMVGDEVVQLDISGVSQGIYLLLVKHNGLVFTQRIMTGLH
ncbi:MAG: S8 family serine peptidase [Bacteroidia bacterium]